MSVVIVASACVLPGRSVTVQPAVDAAPSASDPPERVGHDDRFERLVAYAGRVRGLAPALLQAEYAAATEDYRYAPDPFTRLKLAILLACRRAPFRDDARARELLHQVANDASPDRAAARSMATLLLHGLEERGALERALEDERGRRHALQRKLEQLKSIEEEIDRRPSPPVVPSR